MADWTAWTPVRADEIDPTTGSDRFPGQTFELSLTLLTSNGVRARGVSIFLPLGASGAEPRVHVFWSPGDATETGLPKLPPLRSRVGSNGVMMHGLRGAARATEWIVIGVPGVAHGFVSFGKDDIAKCLDAVNVTAEPSLLRLSAHSRGTNGLAKTLDDGLIDTGKIDRVVIFDAVSSPTTEMHAPWTLDLNKVLKDRRIPGEKQRAYQVNDTATLTALKATNIALDPLVVRAIGYSRLIEDAPTAATAAGASVPAFPGPLLPLPSRGMLATRASASAAAKTSIERPPIAIASKVPSIIAAEKSPAGMKTFIDNHNLTRMGPLHEQIMSHHLFVAELAHEVVD